MRGLAEGFTAGFKLVDDYEEGVQRRRLKEDENRRLNATNAADIETKGLANRRSKAEQDRKDAWLAGVSKRKSAGGVESDTQNYGDSDYGVNFGSVGRGDPATDPAARATPNPAELNQLALETDQISFQDYENNRKRIRAEEFNKTLGARAAEISKWSDDQMRQAMAEFSSDPDTHGTAHWATGGMKGKTSPAAGKGGYGYVMVGDSQPFKLNRAETAQMIAAYALSRENPDNYDLAFGVLDSGSKNMRELASKFRQETVKAMELNNQAMHFANTDETNRGHLALARENAAMGRMGAPVDVEYPDGRQGMIIPQMTRGGVNAIPFNLPEGARLTKPVNPAEIQRTADWILANEGTQDKLQNGKAVKHTPETAYDSAKAMLYGRPRASQGPNAGADARAIQALLAQQSTPKPAASGAFPTGMAPRSPIEDLMRRQARPGQDTPPAPVQRPTQPVDWSQVDPSLPGYGQPGWRLR